MKTTSDSLAPAAAFTLALALVAGSAASREQEPLGVSSQELKIETPPTPASRSAPSSTNPSSKHNARWSSYNFAAPNGGLLVYTIMPDGNPACASYDGRGCLWGIGYGQVDFSRVRPLVCGQAHRALYQVTGYEDPKHWCSVARRLQPRGN